MRSHPIIIVLLIIFAGCNSGHEQSIIRTLPEKQKQFVNLIHKHDSIHSSLANDLAKAEYVNNNRKGIAEFALTQMKEVTNWQATLYKINAVDADGLLNAEFLLSNIHKQDSIFLQHSFLLDSLQLKLQIKEKLESIKVNDKVSISGFFTTNDINKDLEQIDFSLDDQRKYKTTRFLFYLTDVKKAK